MKTAKEHLTLIANEHSYETWDELMYDSHGEWQIQCTIEAMNIYATEKVKEAIKLARSGVQGLALKYTEQEILEKVGLTQK